MTADPALTAAVAEAQVVAQKIKKAKNYAEADESLEDMLDITAILNDLSPALESAERILKAVRVLTPQVTLAERAMEDSIKLAKRLKVDSSADIMEMQELLEQAKAGLAAIKTGGIDSSLLIDYSQTQVISAVAEITARADNFRLIKNVRRHAAKVTADLKRYDKLISRKERKKEDMTDERALVAEARQNLAELQPLTGASLTVDTAEAILDLMNFLTDINKQLDEALGIAKPSAVERNLRRVISADSEKVKPYNSDPIEQLII